MKNIIQNSNRIIFWLLHDNCHICCQSIGHHKPTIFNPNWWAHICWAWKHHVGVCVHAWCPFSSTEATQHGWFCAQHILRTKVHQWWCVFMLSALFWARKHPMWVFLCLIPFHTHTKHETHPGWMCFELSALFWCNKEHVNPPCSHLFHLFCKPSSGMYESPFHQSRLNIVYSSSMCVPVGERKCVTYLCLCTRHLCHRCDFCMITAVKLWPCHIRYKTPVSKTCLIFLGFILFHQHLP